MRAVVLFFGLALAAVTALPLEDPVIAKLDNGGPRYQYMSGPDGPQLVDLWLKKSDLLQSARFDPQVSNNYHLFTRENRLVSQPIPLGNAAILQTSNFDANKKTVVLIHGWVNLPTSVFNVHMVSAYLNAEDVNVIMVDWSIGAGADYLVALKNVIISADHVASYITWLIGASGGDIARYHIIGHSLGAHQAGIVGRHLGGVVPYITALDPAMPGWITNSQAFSSNAAIYTEVMHTNIGLFGLMRPSGHVDFYPNGGRSMPGCSDNDCDHHQCIYYMAESLEHGGFTGVGCNSLTDALLGNCDLDDSLHMGGTEPKTGKTGIFYLTTNAWSPYSQD